MTEKQYIRNQVHFSPHSGCFYFVTRVVHIGGGVSRVVGKKYDVTDSIAPYLMKKYRPVKKPTAVATKKARAKK